MSKLSDLPWVWWSSGEPEDDLYGFLTVKERDAYGRGERGPFRRRVRDLRTHPISPEEAVMTAMFAKWKELSNDQP